MLGPSGFRDGQARRNGSANSNQSSFSVQCLFKGLKYLRWMLRANSPWGCVIFAIYRSGGQIYPAVSSCTHFIHIDCIDIFGQSALCPPYRISRSSTTPRMVTRQKRSSPFMWLNLFFFPQVYNNTLLHWKATDSGSTNTPEFYKYYLLLVLPDTLFRSTAY